MPRAVLTVEDLYRWDQALYDDRVLPRALRQAMFTASQGGYGYGWWITEKHGQPLITHGGAMDGFRSDMQRYPDRRVTVIMLTNDDYRTWEVSPGPRLMNTIGRLMLRP
jgi:hypothetical protein